MKLVREFTRLGDIGAATAGQCFNLTGRGSKERGAAMAARGKLSEPFSNGHRSASVVVVDDQPIWLDAVGRVLAEGGVDVVGAATSTEEALDRLAQEQPAGLVTSLELQSSKLEPADFIRKARGRAPNVRIVAVSAHETPFSRAAAAAAGADAYLAKTRAADEFAAEVRACLNGGCSARARVLRSAHREQLDAFDLTDREAEILALVADGFTNAEIAARLWVTKPTVKFHLVNAYRKLGVSNRTQAARFMYEHGLVPAPLDRSA
jgi:DNA-binding NarL/FixJ family response regulator